jgi:hypothetical protein
MVIGCEVVLKNLPTDRPSHIVIFVWCDNTSAIAWLTRYKSNHPTINFVLQVWSRLQTNHSATINSGHIRGIFNTVPDAISRHFQVQNGLQIKQSLSHLTAHRQLPTWYQDMLTSSTLPSRTAWQRVVGTLIALAQTL